MRFETVQQLLAAITPDPREEEARQAAHRQWASCRFLSHRLFHPLPYRPIGQRRLLRGWWADQRCPCDNRRDKLCSAAAL